MSETCIEKSPLKHLFNHAKLLVKGKHESFPVFYSIHAIRKATKHYWISSRLVLHFSILQMRDESLFRM